MKKGIAENPPESATIQQPVPFVRFAAFFFFSHNIFFPFTRMFPGRIINS
jgi:hypothetical protein